MSLVIQIISATWWLKPYMMPNAALVIASTLAASGRYEGGNWQRLKGTVVPTDPPLRSYHLPGEPVYLAAGLALHQPALFAYWHVPVAVLLVVATAAVALALFGPDAALLAGLIAAFDPLIVIHGAVYDDTFLGAALFWLIAAIALSRWVATRSARNAVRSNSSWVVTPALVIISGWAAVTRTEALVAVVGVAAGCLAIPGLRALRSTGLAIAFGVILAVGGWGERNAIVQHRFMTGSSHDGVTLWESTEPNAMRALALGQVNALSADSSIVGAIWQQTAGKDEVGANEVFVRAAIQEMRDDPIRVAAFGVHKIGISIAGIRPELPISAPRNLVSILSTLVLVCLAIAGAARVSRVARKRDPVRHLAGVGACVLGLELLGVLALGPVGLRYWILWRPVLWILAGQALLGLRQDADALSTSAHQLPQIPASSAADPRSNAPAR